MGCGYCAKIFEIVRVVWKFRSENFNIESCLSNGSNDSLKIIKNGTFFDLNHTQIYPEEIEFKIVHMTKKRKIVHEPVKLTFNHFENELFDVMKHIL